MCQVLNNRETMLLGELLDFLDIYRVSQSILNYDPLNAWLSRLESLLARARRYGARFVVRSRCRECSFEPHFEAFIRRVGW